MLVVAAEVPVYLGSGPRVSWVKHNCVTKLGKLNELFILCDVIVFTDNPQRQVVYVCVCVSSSEWHHCICLVKKKYPLCDGVLVVVVAARLLLSAFPPLPSCCDVTPGGRYFIGHNDLGLE